VTSISKLQAWWQVRDPVLRRKLRPDFPIGCKRILLTNAWLPALVRPNVDVIDDAIAEITETGVRTADGQLREVDAIIYGTGFKATQFLTPMRVRGLGGKDLHQSWGQGAEAYYGMAVSGFPNFYMLYGPNTNVGSGSIIYMLERQQRYIARLLKAREAHGWDWLDLRAEAQAAYAAEMQQRSAGTTYSGDCQSWYKTADGRNTNNWVGSMTEFSRRLRMPVLADYRGVTRPVAVPKAA
jgi:cation diffusion facilitator CzcD-associated flavoprotein CzcO